MKINKDKIINKWKNVFGNNVFDNIEYPKAQKIYANTVAQDLITNSNYRKPSIDEFIDGFEFEVYSEGYFEDSIEDFCGWYTYIYNKSNWRTIEQIKELLINNEIRVIV